MVDLLNSDRMEGIGRLISEGIDCGDDGIYVSKFRQDIVIFEFDGEDDLFVVKQFLLMMGPGLFR